MNNFAKLILFIVFCFSLNTCTDKQNTKYEYYKNGKIKKKVIYDSPKDSTSFTAFIYFKNGNISHKTTFDNGKREGNYFAYYRNGNIKMDFFYQKGQRHGVQKEYTPRGELKKESFYLNEKHILLKEFYESRKGNLSKANCYLVKDSVLRRIGSYIYNKNNIIKDNASFYYKVYGKDTIKINDTTSYGIKFFNKREDFLFNLQIGKLKKDLKFADSTEVKEYTTYKDSIVYTFVPEKTGNQLLLGRIHLVKDTVNLEFPFYKEYFVKAR